MKKIIALLLLISSLTACYTPRRAARQVIKAQTVYPVIVAENCGLWYPPKEFTTTNTKYIRGKDSVIRDTSYVDCTEPGNIYKKDVAVPCEQKVRVDTFEKEVIKQVENTAKIEALTDKNNRLQENNAGLKTLVRILAVACSVLSAIMAIFFIIKFVKHGKST